MLSSVYSTGGIVTAPHHLASDIGRDVLRDGGNAIEAMIAMAAIIPVVYPHMNAIGGDGFWIIKPSGKKPIGIYACGAAAASATPQLYRAKGLTNIPTRGPLAANTVAGTLSGWSAAQDIGSKMGGKQSRERLLEPAIFYAERGFPMTENQARTTREKLNELKSIPGFERAFLLNGMPPKEGELFQQRRLGATLRRLAADGFDSFYRGPLARDIAADLARAGTLLTIEDLEAHNARILTPLNVQLSTGTVWNMPPPTQGVASLITLGLFDRIPVQEPDTFTHIHVLVECIKQAFLIRDIHVQDPAVMTVNPEVFLQADYLDTLAEKIDHGHALPWSTIGQDGDTVWMGALDKDGNAVSFIQSIYWEFGSALVLEDTGILWQNRGCSFSLKDGSLNQLAPNRRPFHTLNPALAELVDDRVLSFGAMGGEGQPQTQSLIYSRHVQFGQGLQQAITAPRFLLGRTWGDTGTNLKIESRFGEGIFSELRSAGHDLETIQPFSNLMGHAGAVVLNKNGLMEGASDPRSDGKAAGI